MSWIDVDYDVDKWLWVPGAFGRGEKYSRPKKWARAYAQALWELDEAGPDHDDQVKELALVLELFAKRQPTSSPGQQTYLYVPDPRRMPIPLYVQPLRWAEGEEPTLRELVRADEPDAVEKPVVDVFATEHLGEGLRTLRYFTDPGDNSLQCALTYGWQLREHDFDLRLYTVNGAVGEMAVAAEDFDELARSVRIRSEDERPGDEDDDEDDDVDRDPDEDDGGETASRS